MKKSFKGLSILEVIVVTIIIGILAALGLASFAGPKEQVLNREAQANLKLISSAEKIYRLEFGGYVSLLDVSEINNNLRLMIPTSNPSWEYKVVDVTASAFSAKARRISGFNQGKTYCIDQVLDNAFTGGSCAW